MTLDRRQIWSSLEEFLGSSAVVSDEASNAPAPDHSNAQAPIAWTMAARLISAFSGRGPLNEQDARRLASISAGVLPVGFDAVIDALLEGDIRRAIEVHRLATEKGSPAAATIAAETLVGSWKASGQPGANEDAAIWTARGARKLLLVSDGITGSGDGSGYRAAHAAVDAAAAAWEAMGNPDELLAAGDQAATGACGGATLVAVDFDPGAGQARITSLGDSSAWLLRRDADLTACFRLTPIHTVHAARVLADADATGHESVLTHFLGGRADRPHAVEIGTRAGDLIVACTDGTEVHDVDEPFSSALVRISEGVRAVGRPLAPAVAVELVVRAERLSGTDNATAAVISFTPLPGDEPIRCRDQRC